eukprot:g11205.t2
MSMHGELFTYSPKKRLAAFRSDGGGRVGEQRQRYVVFVPGLTDGLLALDYVPALAAAMDKLGYSFVQPVLSSSYKGYGTSSLRQDVEELDELLDCLSSAPPSSSSTPPVPATFVLIGHSTGCQDAVFYMQHGRPDLRAKVLGVVLQAPVSDREQLATLPDTAALIEEATARRGGRDLMPATASDAPITPERFLSLATKDGDDDMFSADLSAEERHARLSHMASVPTAAFLSGADEFVPPPESGGPVPEALAETLRAAMVSTPPPGIASAGSGAGFRGGGAHDGRQGSSATSAVATKTVAYVIAGANHALSAPAHAEEFIAKVEAFVAGLAE